MERSPRDGTLGSGLDPSAIITDFTATLADDEVTAVIDFATNGLGVAPGTTITASETEMTLELPPSCTGPFVFNTLCLASSCGPPNSILYDLFHYCVDPPPTDMEVLLYTNGSHDIAYANPFVIADSGCAAGSNTITADTTDPLDWTVDSTPPRLHESNVSSFTPTENFGSVLEEDSEATFNSGGGTTRHALEYSAQCFDPSSEGAITGFSYTVDHSRPGGNFSHPFRVALVQDGKFYSYFGAAEHRDNSNDSTFTTFAISDFNAAAADWYEVSSSGVGDISSNPDFSASGTPISIALIVRHGSSSAGLQHFVSEFDEFSVTFNPTTPVPSLAPLALATLCTLIGLAGLRRLRN